MSKCVDLSGEVFGRLIVMEIGGKDKRNNTLWKCLCACGNEVLVYGSNLKSGGTRSCGCLQKERASETKTTHGLSNTPLYHSLEAAKSRVTNPNNPEWDDYGGRGIIMCQEWLDSSSAFLQDMGPSWQEGLTLERKDTDGNYCPENCKWDTESNQNHNRRKLKGCSSRYKGVSLHKRTGKFRVQIRDAGKVKYLGSFTDELEAATLYDNHSEKIYGDRPNNTPRKEKQCT